MSLHNIILQIDADLSNRGRSPQAKSISIFADQLKGESRDLSTDVDRLIAHGTTGAWKVALSCLPTSKSSRTKDLARVLVGADHDSWEIREYAAEALAKLLESDFEHLLPKLRALRSDSSANRRRAVVVALKYLGRKRNPSQLNSILDLLGLYADDEAPYVMKAHGPFALGDAMLLYAPDETLALLEGLSRHRSSIARWNAAATFTTASSAEWLGDALPIIEELLTDSDSRVRRAALKALRVGLRRRSDLRSAIERLLQRADVRRLHPQPALDRTIGESK